MLSSQHENFVADRWLRNTVPGHPSVCVNSVCVNKWDTPPWVSLSGLLSCPPLIQCGLFAGKSAYAFIQQPASFSKALNDRTRLFRDQVSAWRNGQAFNPCDTKIPGMKYYLKATLSPRHPGQRQIHLVPLSLRFSDDSSATVSHGLLCCCVIDVSKQQCVRGALWLSPVCGMGHISQAPSMFDENPFLGSFVSHLIRLHFGKYTYDAITVLVQFGCQWVKNDKWAGRVYPTFMAIFF